jgi:hypothetical protein
VKITMLGRSGSGKTTYMAALYERLMADHFHGFSMQPSATDLISALQMRAQFSRISFSNLEHNFPDGTAKTAVWSFDLLHQASFVSQFEWIDYRGGLLDYLCDKSATDNPDIEEQFEELLAHIASSEAVLIFLDGIVLTHFPTRGKRLRQTGLDAINAILQGVAHYYPTKALSIIAMVTKTDSDAIPEEARPNNFRSLLEQTASDIDWISMQCRKPGSRWKGAVLPVGAIGEGNVTTEVFSPTQLGGSLTVSNRIQGDPEPYNVPEALFYCIHSCMERIACGQQFAIEEDRRALEAAIRRSTLFKRFVARALGDEDPLSIVNRLERKRSDDIRALVAIKDHVARISHLVRSRVLPL